MILLPETQLDQAAGLAETLRAGLHVLSRLGVGPVSASFGVAGYRPDETLEQWIKCVDNLVYQAKREGRDRVRFRPE
jgi:diguanylate cyclase (GGDEF)-like protein